ncbi:MAG: AAA family ATPase [Pirellulales bacterium]
MQYHMRISSVSLRNFKRFTDLSIKDIPKSAKLVLVVGPNGCGKSSLFDAFLHWFRMPFNGGGSDQSYSQKHFDQPFSLAQAIRVELYDNPVRQLDSLYVRTAYRNDPDFSVDAISRLANPAGNVLRLTRTIDNDQTVSENYRRLVYETTAAVYDQRNDQRSVLDLRNELIGEIRESMKRVFGDLLLSNITDPLAQGNFYFEKGSTRAYHYKNLSGGEKAAFDLLLDLHLKRKFFPNAVYCIDEIETHLHTRIQGKLLKEIVRLVPESSQLWITTHSLGVLRASLEILANAPEAVCLIDFEGISPDLPQELIPASLGRATWDKLMSITLDDLSQRIAPKVVVICEGSSVGNRRKDFDAEIYNRCLGAHHPDVVFVSGGAASQIQATGASVREVLSRVIPAARILSLADRDSRSDQEVAEIESKGDLVLGLRNIESYLFTDEIIEALVRREGMLSMLSDAMQIRANAVSSSVARGNPPDDLKSAAGEIYVGLQKLLKLQRCGNGTAAFMRDTLAPLVSKDSDTYRLLKAAIIDRL